MDKDGGNVEKPTAILFFSFFSLLEARMDNNNLGLFAASYALFQLSQTSSAFFLS